MFHRTFAGLIVALIATSGQSPSGLSMAAQPAEVDVSLVGVSPGTPSGDGDWCVDAAVEVTLTAHAVDLASQSELTEGTIEWQTCGDHQGGLPKEDCDGPGPGRWSVAINSFLSDDPLASLSTPFDLPVLGFRMRYRPAPGSGFQRATSESFNLDRTCSL